MNREFRIDTCEAHFDAERTDEGYIRGTAAITRTGVFRYARPDGTVIREFRSPDEVFRADSLATFKLMPVQVEHNEMLDASNMERYKSGHTGDPAVDAPFVRAPVVLDTKRAVEAFDAGKREFSCGYWCELDFTPGTYNGEEYDAVQRNIIGNHLALCDQARLGPEMRFESARMDSQGGTVKVAVRTDSNPSPKQEKSDMADKNDNKTIKLDAIPGCDEKFDGEYEVPAYLSLYFDKLRIAIDGFKKQADKADALEAERDSEKIRADKAEKALKEKEDAFEQAVTDAANERASLIADAKDRVDAETAEKLDSMTAREIKEAVVKTVDSEIDLSKKSNEYLDAAYNMAIKAGKLDGTAAARKQNGDRTAPSEDSEDFSERFAQKRKDSITKTGNKE